MTTHPAVQSLKELALIGRVSVRECEGGNIWEVICEVTNGYHYGLSTSLEIAIDSCLKDTRDNNG